jgi:uncharacterized heparinase superfamily protein
MLPMLRFFRHQDGAVARFNGAGATAFGLVAAVLGQDDARGAPLFFAPHSGYVRLAQGSTVVIADVGPPPPPDLSSHAHAGCLSFEMSAGQRAIVVNSGVDHAGAADFRPLARATAAHSTLTLNDASQARFVYGGRFGRLIGAPLTGGPRRVAFERVESPQAQGFRASHDGYLARFGVTHHRELRLSQDGSLLEGTDQLLPAGDGRVAPLPAVLRFHLHPDVELFRDADGALVLAIPRGGHWRFRCLDLPCRVEESIFFASLGGPRRSRQLVLSFMADATPLIRWRFRRLSDEA